MNYINYNFEGLITSMFNLKQDQSPRTLNQIKYELNKFFKDSKCLDVIFTRNTDKLFFGMCVMPVVKEDDVMEIMTGDNKLRINSYYLEIDSKILDPILNLSANELTATILHEVGHIVNDATPVEEVRNGLASYLATNDEALILSSAIQYQQILAYGIKDSLRKVTSMFSRRDVEIIADEFVVRCGFGNELESAYSKIVKYAGRINRDVSNKFIVLQYVLRVYKNVKMRRINAIAALNKGKASTASVLEKREIDNMIRRLKQIDDDTLIGESVSIFKKASESFKKMKYKGMRALEDDLYEYNLRAKNVDEQDEALIIIRQLNTRIAMIDDFIKTEEQLNEKDKERWGKLLDKYILLREDISKKSTYTEKYYGLFVQTPIIKSRYEV